MRFKTTIAAGAILFPAGSALAFGGSMNQDVDGFYMVEDCLDLQAVGAASFGVAAAYKLVADIDCSDTMNWNGGAGFEPIGRGVTWEGFHGVLDGQGHVVSSLYIDRPSDLSVGLIGDMGGETCDVLRGEIRSIGLADVDITGRWTVGALVGQNGGSPNGRGRRA